MELSSSALLGLQVAGTLTDESFGSLLTHALTSLEHKNRNDEAALSEAEQAPLKEAASALSTLLLEAARTDVDAAGISALLEECKFAPDRTDTFTRIYTENKAHLRAQLARLFLKLTLTAWVSSSPPHVVDVHWRLDYHIKSNHVERVNKPVYLIELQTQMVDCVRTQTVLFACTQEQLQDLVSKLKDASKSLEKFSQQY